MNQEKIGKFIRELRIEKQMTQQELADTLGVTDSAISKWETGRGAPDITFLIPLSKELNITVLELLNGEKGIDENSALIKLIKEKDKKTKVWKYLAMIITNILLVIMTIILIFGYIIPMVYENSTSKGMTRILSASMEPTLEVGKYIIYDKTSIKNVKKDDIVVFNWAYENGTFLVSENGNIRIIHRVVEVQKGENGNISLITKGDNNDEVDNLPVTSHNFVGIYKRTTSNLTTFFLKQQPEKYPFVFIFLIINIIIIISFDIREYIKYLKNRAL